jgi:hypothetical protein
MIVLYKLEAELEARYQEFGGEEEGIIPLDDLNDYIVDEQM